MCLGASWSAAGRLGWALWTAPAINCSVQISLSGWDHFFPTQKGRKLKLPQTPSKSPCSEQTQTMKTSLCYRQNCPLCVHIPLVFTPLKQLLRLKTAPPVSSDLLLKWKPAITAVNISSLEEVWCYVHTRYYRRGPTHLLSHVSKSTGCTACVRAKEGTHTHTHTTVLSRTHRIIGKHISCSAGENVACTN